MGLHEIYLLGMMRIKGGVEHRLYQGRECGHFHTFSSGSSSFLYFLIGVFDYSYTFS